MQNESETYKIGSLEIAQRRKKEKQSKKLYNL
jgi:hypothetical protein